ncbi:hypothetical protein BDW22DRAFT_1427763 [Trametopsis cervina]|nr:hypothetical protein BDW22DRAFT_1427763 [Trametopsis cervina]
MAAPPAALDSSSAPAQEKWTASEKKADTTLVKTEANGEPHTDDASARPAGNGADYSRNGSAAPDAASNAGSKQDSSQRGEKQIKVLPNKVYIGGLPEHTRKEDLEGCFGKLGTIVNIELKVGYGFVEFDSREAAEESVAKYHEGFFMGNKIRVELSHGGGRTAKYSNDPGACFKCGQVGHWARECPNSSVNGDARRSAAPLIDRIQSPRDYPPRDYPPYDYLRYPRDPRYAIDFPPSLSGRDYRRPPSPPRDYRDYAPAVRPAARDLDDYRSRPPLAPPYDSRAAYHPPEPDAAGYSRYPAAPPRDYYDRRAPPGDRYAPYPPPARARSPPPRDDYERPPPRDYPPPSDYRGRPPSPPRSRYSDYPRAGSSEAPPRYRRRSQSPPPRSAAYDSAYPSGGHPYNGSSAGYGGGGYTRDPPARAASSARDYPPPRTRDGDPGYRRL